MEKDFKGRENTQKKNTMTRECIFTALLLLMEQMPYEDITITDITKKAGVSRMSYYRLYDSKDDILEQRFGEIYKEGLEQMCRKQVMDKYQFVTELFRTAEKNHVLIEALLHARLHDLVQKNLIQYCTYLAEHIFRLDMKDQRTDYWIYMVSGKFSMLIARWIEKGMPESPEEMAAFSMEDIVLEKF